MIITNGNDKHSDLIAKKLNKREESFVRLNTEDFPTSLKITLNDPSVRQSEISSRTGSCYIDEIHSVWYRRPEKPVINPAITDEPVAKLAQKESNTALAWLYGQLSDRL